jgi:hypothetical protein
MLRRARPEPVPNSELQEHPSSLFIDLSLPRRVEVHELANPMVEPENPDAMVSIETANSRESSQAWIAGTGTGVVASARKR